MHRALRWLDATGAWGLVLLGTIHNFVAAPAIFDGISEDLFWFIGAGLALWYAGALNLVRQATATRVAVIVSIPVNLTLLAMLLAFGIHTGEIAEAGGMILALFAIIETSFSVAQAIRNVRPSSLG